MVEICLLFGSEDNVVNGKSLKNLIPIGWGGKLKTGDMFPIEIHGN